MFLCQWHVRTDKLARGAQSENCKFTTRLCRCSEPIIYTINDNNNNSPTTKGHRRIMMMMIGLVGAKNRFVTYLPSRDVQGRCACLSLSLCFSPSSARSTWHTHNCLSANVKLSGRPVGSPSRTLSLPQFSLLLLYIYRSARAALAPVAKESLARVRIFTNIHAERANIQISRALTRELSYSSSYPSAFTARATMIMMIGCSPSTVTLLLLLFFIVFFCSSLCQPKKRTPRAPRIIAPALSPSRRTCYTCKYICISELARTCGHLSRARGLSSLFRVPSALISLSHSRGLLLLRL